MGVDQQRAYRTRKGALCEDVGRITGRNALVGEIARRESRLDPVRVARHVVEVRGHVRQREQGPEVVDDRPFLRGDVGSRCRNGGVDRGISLRTRADHGTKEDKKQNDKAAHGAVRQCVERPTLPDAIVVVSPPHRPAPPRSRPGTA